MLQVGQPFNPFGMFNGVFIPDGLLEYPHLSSSAKLVWCRLVKYGGKDGRAFPKIATLAGQVGLSEVQVQRLLTELSTQGFLIRQKATGQQRLQHFPDTYLFLFHSCLYPSLRVSGDIVDDTSEDIVDDTSNQENQYQENQKTSTYTESDQLSPKSATPVKKKRQPKNECALPPGFRVSDVVRVWASEKGYTRLEERLEHFKDAALARGYVYSDWDAAFRGAIRDDWAKLGKSGTPTPPTPTTQPQLTQGQLAIRSAMRRQLAELEAEREAAATVSV